MQFNDRLVDLRPNESGEYFDGPGTQYVNGTGSDETFVIDGDSADYQWAPTEDGTGTVVWNDAGFDLLFEFEQIEFNDKTVEVSEIFA